MNLWLRIVSIFILICIYIVTKNSICSALSQKKQVAMWADQLGKELWNLGKIVTNRRHIESNYKIVNVETKNPRQIISEIVGNVSYMMEEKMKAVRCIIHAAENLAEAYNDTNDTANYYYYRSNVATIYYSSDDPDPDANMYLPMILDNDTHFFNLAVNTTHSSVHVPTNIYHKHNDSKITIKWSQNLDEVFQQNYKADPSLFWQYFGSSSGVMRHYPAMDWGDLDKGLYDCRIQTWFIEAATCTKDVVILVDNSGSMEGMHKHIASFVVNTILDTLSNNDYVNILTYNESVKYLVPCFEDITVQATKENLNVFRDALKMLIPDVKSDLGSALRKAFDLLYKYREKRECHKNSKYCNQAIMIVSDEIANNISDIVDQYNRVKNGSSIPIRIFTYLVGQEANNLEESLEIACNNRGFHTHVDALEQVKAAVNKYVLVFARPLVLQAKRHPLSWTHAYFDTTFNLQDNSKNIFEQYRLLISVAGPAFDRKSSPGNRTRPDILLGVAGTDVPLDEIAKLMSPYKTGVNSHSFIVSNNGYVLKHPGLRPMFEGILTDNYNSIDLTEIEQLDDDLRPRELGDLLIDLRRALVEGHEGVFHDLKIKYYYDDMRRVSREVNDYYFAPIRHTPFTLGFAMPDLYGNYSIEVGDAIDVNRNSMINISTYFDGSNWKIHPRWVYCKYHYLEGHEFSSPEKELVHFVNRMNTDDFKWSMQYETDDRPKSLNDACGAKTLGDSDYYCDKNLMNRLVFDAKNTKSAFEEKWTAETEPEANLKKLYNASLRFVATMSGLTRWEYISEGSDFENTTTFGDLHPMAIDEIWYKSAVIQHRYNNESFVYSVPFGRGNSEDILVTGSFAIFPEKDGISAPAAVVGLQFSHDHLQRRFYEITTSTCNGCTACGVTLDCYIIDSSGYIILSNSSLHVGTFFGKIDSCAMEAMLRKSIFEKVTIRDYQAICYFQQWISADGSILRGPVDFIKTLINWTISQIIMFIVNIDICIADVFQGIISITTIKPRKSFCTKHCQDREEAWHEKNRIPIYEQRHTACEKERDLYIFRQDNLPSQDGTYFNYPFHRPFFLKPIPYSNLILVTIKKKVDNGCYFAHTTDIRDIFYDNATMFPCQKLYLNDLVRRPLDVCFNEDPLEKEITACGKSSRLQTNFIILYYIIFLAFYGLRNVKY